MNRPLLYGCIALLLSTAPISSFAQEQKTSAPFAGKTDGWSSFVRGGAIYQFETDVDDGSSFDSSRFNIQGGIGYRWASRTAISFNLSYSLDSYDFSGNSGFGMTKPWDDIHTLSFSVPVRYAFNDSWTGFMIPSIRSTGESGASFDDTVTGSFLGGVSYKVSDSLTIGPGIGVISQIEDDATIIPILLIDWKITDKWSLNTGGGLAATVGPGIVLNYKPNSQWTFGLGARYEKLRFRLDKNGDNESGVGEDSSIPIFASCSYNLSPKTSISLVGGVEFGGELKVDDNKGNTITKEDYDNAIFLGLTMSSRF